MLEKVFFLNDNQERYMAAITIKNINSILKKSNEFNTHIFHQKEVDHINSIKFEKSRCNYILGRACGKIAIKNLEPKITLNEIYISNGILGKPIIKGNVATDYDVSISHSHMYGAAVVYEKEFPVAIDIEALNGKCTKAIYSILSEKEISMISKMDNEEVVSTVFWTAKEALGKILGIGINVDLSIFEIQTIKANNSFFFCTFEKFPQYQTCSFIFEKNIISLVYSKKFKISL